MVSLIASLFVFAGRGSATTFSDVDQCLGDSGGHQNIDSVIWQCRTKVNNPSNNVCSLWIGKDAQIPKIYLDYMPEEGQTVPIMYFGMCTDHEAPTAEIRVSNDGDSIGDDLTLNRGNWQRPNSMPSTLRLDLFVKGLTPTETSEGLEFSRTVNIYRCYGTYSNGRIVKSTAADACSSMNEKVVVVIRPQAQKYLGASSVSNRDSQTSGGGSDYATTGITDTERSASTPDITGKNVGDKVSLTFSHNAFTVLQASNVSWSVKRTLTIDGKSQEGFNGGENFDIDAPSNNNSSGGTGGVVNGSGDTGADRSDNWLYYRVQGKPRDYSDGGNKYLLRDFYTVTFKKGGTYEFCEALTVNGKNLTKVCSKIIVSGGGGTGDEGFYTVSNISNSKIGGYTTTGLNGGPLVEKSTDTIEVKVNDTVDVVFSHNIYADEKTNGVAWKVTREGLSGVTGVTISRQSGSGLTTSVSGVANLTVEENGKFAAENRLGSDGASKYLVREKYTLKFTRENSTGYKFCETIGLTVNGASRDYTKVCTTIKVKKDGDGPSGSKCGLWTPPSYINSNSTTGTTSVVTKIYNGRLSGTYSGWRGEIDEGTSPATPVALDKRITYARPGDTVEWVSCYWPGVQKVANTTVTFKHAGHPLYLGSGNATNTNENYLFSNSKFGTWENKFNITTVGGISASPSSGTMLVGDSSAKESTTTHFVNATADVGKYFEETISGGYSPVWATTNLEEAAGYSWSCNPYRCPISCPPCINGICNTCWTTCYYSCSHTNDYVEKDRKNGPVVSGPARVEVPYNFINETGVSVSPTVSGVDVVYAGETINVNEPYVKVKDEKYNSLTEDSYATVVDNAQVRLIAYASSSPVSGVRIEEGYNAGTDVCAIIKDDLSGYCETVKRVDNTRLNEGGDLNGAEYYNNIRGTSFHGVYNVFDVDAGKQMCFVMAVYPYTSGDDNNLSADGDKKWFISAPACKVVAKKPSVQILGAGVFSAGSILTNTSNKAIINGVYDYTAATAQNFNNTTVFGSWAEQAVVANGTVSGFASGAATGRRYVGDTLGGSLEGATVNFCNNRVPLSFANTSSSYISGICPGAEATGRLGIAVSTVNRQALVDYFITGTKTGQRDGDYEKIASGTGKDIYVADVTSGNYAIGGRTLYANETRVVKVAGNATITGNIMYNDQYYSVYNVPKMVIYASGNINISCSVTRVDAILITMGTVVTCPGYSATDSSTWNADARTSQLIINGAVVANRIDFGRTYGNTIGYGSDDPAEAINYDTSSVLWGRSMADAGESDTLTVVYQRELAPRY